MNKSIANEIIEMARYDLQVREELLKAGKLSPGYNPDMERVHLKNAARLDEIINIIGYPTSSKVGKEASEAAWLIVQHAISKPTLMKKCYALLSEASGDVNPQNLAYLHDRICYFEGRPQKFGTQFDDRGLYPVEDKDETIRLRKGLQLGTHDEALIIEAKKTQIDLHPHDKDFNLWRKKVGWI
jgi:hypothetical protein